VNWGFVGGRDFNAHALAGLLESVPPTDTIVVGSGIGSEKFIREQARELKYKVVVPDLREDLYGDQAKDCQVTDVVVSCIGGQLILMGGGRTKIAKAIIKRVGDDWWQEVIEQ